MGWHLPTIEELSTLVDPTVPAPGSALPAGHPFTNIIASSYWSTTTDVRVQSSQHKPVRSALICLGKSAIQGRPASAILGASVLAAMGTSTNESTSRVGNRISAGSFAREDRMLGSR